MFWIALIAYIIGRILKNSDLSECAKTIGKALYYIGLVLLIIILILFILVVFCGIAILSVV